MTRGDTNLFPHPPDPAAALARLGGDIVTTPTIRSEALDRLVGTRVWLKLESLQHTGSYKYRGALNAVRRVKESGGYDGVLAQSTGNHGIAVAAAAQNAGLDATIVLPEDVMAGKVKAIEGYGAKPVLAGTTLDDRYAALAELKAASDSDNGRAVIESFDNPDVLSGQGSASLELIRQVRDAGGELDALVISVGGGSGLAGACLAARAAKADLTAYGVEPVGCDSWSESSKAGEPVTVKGRASIADGLRPTRVGDLPFAIASDAGARSLVVDDNQIALAMRDLMVHGKVLSEPSAAAGLAGVRQIADGYDDIGVVVTGGNIDPAVLVSILAMV